MNNGQGAQASAATQLDPSRAANDPPSTGTSVLAEQQTPDGAQSMKLEQ
jgi:hypothetical protein